jgi:acyl-coenzyme A synthetase/AMP-(fatty) acid ligase
MLVVRHLSFTQKDAFNGLLVGAAIFPYDIRKQGISELPKVIAKNALTYFTSTPSLFRSFVGELDDTQYFPSVRLIQLGGEPLFKAEMESFKKHFAPGCTLMNQLSMNEAGTICQYLITHATEISTEIVPVGYPVEGREVFLVDDQRQNIGCSGVGEIAVKSRYLSNGYLGDGSLTDKRYSSDPHVPEERIYYTGDFGQMLPDGRVIYIGRRDDEVKIRGGKVRASEVQAHLLGHPKVKNAIVLPRKNRIGELSLVAYVVCKQDTRSGMDELNRFLRGKLPGYMIPAHFIFLDSLPYTPGGKVDRMALPEPRTSRPDLQSPYVAPRSDVEKTLAAVWEEVLEINPVGVDDNFLDIGGHSLAATRICSRCIKQFQLDIPLDSLFQSPTVAKMAEVITQHRNKTLARVEMQSIVTQLESISDEEAMRLVSESRRGDSKN